MLFVIVIMHIFLTGMSKWIKPSLKLNRLAPHGSTSLRLYMTQINGGVEWPVQRVRSTFVEYFEKRQEHTHFRSSPVVPVNDPTLLFANAGMNQFKSIFVGTVEPSSPLSQLTRAVNSQKCIRAGGKHNDLEDVGKDTYHHTFFEMLGTWSFGNYFKKEAIDWAFDILVNTYKLPKERLYASYFGGDKSLGLPCDDEARDLWLRHLPSERVLPFDKKANFWEMGDSGPCGPCSEIHFDRIGNRDASALVNADDPDVIEIWNLVFIQYNREISGELRQLPKKHIDTGMGLERLTSILQGKRSNYDTDIFMPIFEEIQKVTGAEGYTGKLGKEDAAQNFRDMAYRVVADHIRTLTFAITDGAQPSNEGRGYVLRRILRRAVRYGMQTLGAPPGFFASLVPVVVRELGGAFPELAARQAHVIAVIADEERTFSSLLEKGVRYFEDTVREIEASASGTLEPLVLSGDMAFYMYDTLGFPIDLTQLMAAEKGLRVDTAGFEDAMTTQKERSRADAREKKLAGRAALTLGPEQISQLQTAAVALTDDSHKYNTASAGADELSISTQIVAIYTQAGFVDSLPVSGDTVGILLRDTPFYAEAGGQVSDTGVLRVRSSSGGDAGEELSLEVLDVKSYGGYVLHTCVVQESAETAATTIAATGGTVVIAKGADTKAAVDYAKRRKVAPNHTMTHVLNNALRKVLGDDVDQKGSLVSEEKFRFDFSYGKVVSTNDLIAVEDLVNGVIKQQLVVNCQVVPLKEAIGIKGIRAVFGEMYPDPVRVVSVGAKVGELLATPDDLQWLENSIEFCGGTHIANTAEASAFVITEETAVAKGVRRLSGVTGSAAGTAQKIGDNLKKEVSSLLEKVKVLKETTEVDGSSIDAFDASVSTLRGRLEDALISQALKSNLRSNIETAQRDLASFKNKQLLLMVDRGIQAAKEVVAQESKLGKDVCVLELSIGSETKATKRAIDEIRKVDSAMSFLCISREPLEDHDCKATVFAYATDAAQGKLKANEWVSRVLSPFGGRGGGKPGLAQGSVALKQATQYQELVGEARRYPSSL